MQEVVVLIPVLNDWRSVSRLLEGMGRNRSSDLSIEIVIVNDGSTDSVRVERAPGGIVKGVQVVSLDTNLGHQRAIAVGLAWLALQGIDRPVVVMDGDGEDRPEALDVLVKTLETHPASIVVAQRRDRHENVRFRLGYASYRVLFRLLTSKDLDFGNFVILFPDAIRRLVAMNELWNHFPAAIMRSRLPIVKVPIDRGVRYSGESRMNFTALVNHGLAAIAAFIDGVFVRLLVVTGALLGLFSLAAVAVVAIRLWGTWGVPGWATTALGLILLGLLQLVGLLVVVTFLTLSTRSSSSPPPIQFAQQYITEVEEIQ